MKFTETRTIFETGRLVGSLEKYCGELKVLKVCSSSKDGKYEYKIGNSNLTLTYPMTQRSMSPVEYLWEYRSPEDLEESQKFVRGLLSADKR